LPASNGIHVVILFSAPANGVVFPWREKLTRVAYPAAISTDFP
jgi:hypothetical protein